MEGTPSSTNQLQFCEINKVKNPKKNFGTIFETHPKRNKIFNLKKDKSRGFCHFYFATKMTKEEIEKLCGDSIDRSELEDSLLSGFQDSMQKITPIIGNLCSIETNKSLFYDHIN